MRIIQELQTIYQTAKVLARSPLGVPVLAVHMFSIVLIGKFTHIKPQPLRVKFNKTEFAFFINSRVDLAALHEIFVKKEYAYSYEESLGKKPDVIVDLGANIGDSSVYYAVLFPEAKIFAVEPNPAVFDKLKANTSQFSNINVRQCAISNSTGKVTFYVGESHLGSSIKKRAQNTNELEVDMFSLTDFLVTESISAVDILKFDIEGGEEMLLKDAAMKEKVKLFIGEMHDDLTTLPTADLIKEIPAQVLQVYPLSKTRNITVAKAV